MSRNNQAVRTRRASHLLLTAIAAALCAALCGTPGGDGAILTATPSGQAPVGQLRIPAAGVDAALYPVWLDGDGCAPALYHGGRIAARADDADWQTIAVGDLAYVRTDGGAPLVLECVAVGRCALIGRRLIGAPEVVGNGGDVLLCISIGCGPVVWVQRWTIL